MSEEGTHILTDFQRALDGLTKSLNEMADLVRRNLDLAIRGLMERDSTLCAQVIADDEEVDTLEIRIDEEGLKTIMLYQPVASDLRRVVSTMKVSSNLERVGDQAVGIAKRARRMNRNPAIPETRLVEPVYERAAQLLRVSLDAFREGRVDEALGVKEQDAELDKLYKSASKKVTSRMDEDKEHLKDYLDLQFIMRFLERVGDHAKNISEDAVFVEAGMDIRHGGERPSVD